VGAHCGYFTFLAAKWVGATGLVIAYEPDPDTLYWLARNLEANDYDHILLWDVAAGNCAEPVRLYQHENHGWTSAVRKSDHWVERPQRRLDETLLDHADVIKIDVEGVELNVLQGLEGLLPRLPHLALLMDLHPELGVQPQALDDWLHAHDFRLYDIRGGFAPLERIPPTLVELLAVNDSPLIIDEGDDCKNA
jgi:FkbM family methyltransferase